MIAVISKDNTACNREGVLLVACYSLRRLLAQALFIVLLLVFFGGTSDLKAFCKTSTSPLRHERAKVAGRFRCMRE